MKQTIVNVRLGGQYEEYIVVKPGGTLELCWERDGFSYWRHGPGRRFQVIDMAEVERLDRKRPGWRIAEKVRAALAGLQTSLSSQ
jgi:hypothetical protein